jgi:hypothetical protein
MDTLVAVKRHLSKLSRKEIRQLAEDLNHKPSFALLDEVARGRYKSDILYQTVVKLAKHFRISR